MTAETPLRLVRALDLAAASGLVRLRGRSLVVGDDDLALHVVPDAGPGARIVLRPGELPRDPAARKRAKPDFEALCAWSGDAVLALGSGSTLARRTGVFIQLAPDMSSATCTEIDLAPLYAELAARVPELNIEGAAVWDGDLVLVQRGNGVGNRSALIRLDRAAVAEALRSGAAWTAALVRDVAVIELGAIDGVPYSATDAAALPDGGLLLSAAAEASEDTYRDGECLGSALIRVDAPATIGWRTPLPGRAKIEGVWADAEGELLRLHLVADPDDPNARSPLFTARLDPGSGALLPG
jgi:hypothetical protein